VPTAEENLQALGITLAPPAAPVAAYVPFRRAGNTVYVSGQIPRTADGSPIVGKVGRDLTTQQGHEAARACGIAIIAVLKAAVGDLERVAQFVRVMGMVNCTDDFTEQPQVVNGASELFAKVFGDRGRHARAAVGVGSLPLGVAVEVEAMVEIR